MGIDRFSGIDRATKKANDFNKKQASGKDASADQAQIFTVSARLSEARSKLQNARSQSQGQGLVYLDNPTQTAKKENSDAQVKVPPPKAASQQQESQANTKQIKDFLDETSSDIENLEAAKADIQLRLDAAVIANSGEDIDSLRTEFSMLNDASNVSKEHKEFLNTDKLSTKDPDLVKKIQNKKNEILALTFDKSKKPELAQAKQELAQLKSQLFAQ